MIDSCEAQLDEMALHSAEVYVRDFAPDVVKRLMAHKDACIKELRAENAQLLAIARTAGPDVARAGDRYCFRRRCL